MKNHHLETTDRVWIRRLKDWLRESQMSHESLARALGCTRGAVGHYLAGRRHPTLTQLQNIAEVMGVHPVRLIYGIEPTGVADERAPYGPFPKRGTGVPLLGSTLAGPQPGPAGHLDLAGLPGDVYALEVIGNSCAPRAYEGDILLLSRASVPEPGDVVLARLASGETAVYELVATRAGRPALRTMGERPGLHCEVPDHLELLHRVVGVLRQDLVSIVPAEGSKGDGEEPPWQEDAGTVAREDGECGKAIRTRRT